MVMMMMMLISGNAGRWWFAFKFGSDGRGGRGSGDDASSAAVGRAAEMIYDAAGFDVLERRVGAGDVVQRSLGVAGGTVGRTSLENARNP